jgi:rubredoxin
MKNLVKCDLCSAEFDQSEPNYDQRIKRHSDFHNIKIKHATSNINFGNPKYIEV